MDFSEDLFRRHPVWKWNDSMDDQCPVEDYDPLPCDEATLFLSASFVAPAGEEFPGYLIGSDSFFAFGLFVGGKEHIFNFRMPNFLSESLKAVRRQIDDDSFVLFPLKYATSLNFPGQPRIEGVLEDRSERSG